MSCAPLAATGLPVLAVLALAGLFLAAGVALLLVSRSGRGRTATVVLVLLVISGSVYAGDAITARAHAATAGCSDGGSGAGAGAAVRPDAGSSNGSSGSNGGSSSAPTGSATSPSPGGSSTGASENDPHLTIVQTSTITDIAPGLEPAQITGRVTNDGAASTYVTTVTVRVAGITVARPGTCDATDFDLLDGTMPVGRTLAPGESADFTGARISFHDKVTNQDACQAAVVNLGYASS